MTTTRGPRRRAKTSQGATQRAGDALDEDYAESIYARRDLDGHAHRAAAELRKAGLPDMLDALRRHRRGPELLREGAPPETAAHCAARLLAAVERCRRALDAGAAGTAARAMAQTLELSRALDGYGGWWWGRSAGEARRALEYRLLATSAGGRGRATRLKAANDDLIQKARALKEGSPDRSLRSIALKLKGEDTLKRSADRIARIIGPHLR